MLNEKGALLLKQIMKEKYKNIGLENIQFTLEEFWYDFKIDEKLSEKDFPLLEEEMRFKRPAFFVKLLKISGVFLEGNAENEMITRIVLESV